MAADRPLSELFELVRDVIELYDENEISIVDAIFEADLNTEERKAVVGDIIEDDSDYDSQLHLINLRLQFHKKNQT